MVILNLCYNMSMKQHNKGETMKANYGYVITTDIEAVIRELGLGQSELRLIQQQVQDQLEREGLTPEDPQSFNKLRETLRQHLEALRAAKEAEDASS